MVNHIFPPSFTLNKGLLGWFAAAGSDPLLLFSPHTKLWLAARPPTQLWMLTPPPRCSYAIITQTYPVNTKHPIRTHRVTAVKLLRCEEPCVINPEPSPPATSPGCLVTVDLFSFPPFRLFQSPAAFCATWLPSADPLQVSDIVSCAGCSRVYGGFRQEARGPLRLHQSLRSGLR